jgi:DNA ligase-1
MNTIELCALLKSTSSKTGKEQILKDNSSNDELKSILQFVFDSYTVTGISTKKISKPVSQSVTYKADSIFDIMDYLKTHNTGTNEDMDDLLDSEREKHKKMDMKKDMMIEQTRK